jgi:hypothetical protein
MEFNNRNMLVIIWIFTGIAALLLSVIRDSNIGVFFAGFFIGGAVVIFIDNKLIKSLLRIIRIQSELIKLKEKHENKNSNNQSKNRR